MEEWVTAPPHRWVWRARYLRTVDGDTFDVEVDCGFRLFRQERIRLLGVDTPEVVGANRAAGLAAASFTLNWLAEAQYGVSSPFWAIRLETFKPKDRDSFGRWLAVVWREVDGMCLNLDLVSSGHGVAV